MPEPRILVVPCICRCCGEAYYLPVRDVVKFLYCAACRRECVGEMTKAL